MIDGISLFIENSFDVMLYGNPYQRGEYLGLVSVNFIQLTLPPSSAPVLARLATQLSGTRLATTIEKVSASTRHLGRGAAGRLFNIYARAGGVEKAL